MPLFPLPNPSRLEVDDAARSRDSLDKATSMASAARRRGEPILIDCSKRSDANDFNRATDMEDVNPYDPPNVDSQRGLELDPRSIGVITSRFLFTPQHLVAALERFRSQHSGRRLWRWFRYIAAFIFILVAVAGLFAPQYWASALMVALAIFMFFPHKIDDYLATRNFKKTPRHNAEQVIYLSDDGLRTESEVEQTHLKWSAFSKAVIFDDGVLLFRGPKIVNWIPDASLDSEDGELRIRALVAAKLPTNNVMNRG